MLYHHGKSVVAAAALVLLSSALSHAQESSPAVPPKIALSAALVLTPDFCATVKRIGKALMNQEKFAVGKEACKQLEPALAGVFTNLTRVEDPAQAGDAQVILEPKFADIGATQKAFAFSDRELVLEVEWTARDQSGKVLWLETLQGSAKRHIGNTFTHGSNMKHIVENAVQNLAEQSVSKMAASPQLQRFSAQPVK
jgi:hypothetical protein